MPEIPIKYLKYIDNTGNVQKAYGITVLKAVYDADGNTLDEILQTYDNKVGDTSSLTTTANTDLVSAINEVDGNVGDLSGLSTTAKNNLVAAVNELNQNMSKFIPFVFLQNVEFSEGVAIIPAPDGKTPKNVYLTVTFPFTTVLTTGVVVLEAGIIKINGWAGTSPLSQTSWVSVCGVIEVL